MTVTQQPPAKKGAAALVRTPAEQAKVEAYERQKAEKAALAADAARLAQIINLQIAGFTLADIGAKIGATEQEVDRLLNRDMARYVRNQPALRTYVRNYISGKYSALLEAVWDEATNKTHAEKLEHQDRALRILDRMAKLHGAEAPSQTEVKVDAAPEAVERLVNALAASQGLGYDDSIFDVVPGSLVHDVAQESHAALNASGNAADQPQEGEPDAGF